MLALRHQLQVTARVLRDGLWQSIPARQLVPGDVIRLRSGDFVPADVQIIDGEAAVDQSALTGELRELGKSADDPLYSGSIVRRGEATAVVTATGVKTYFGRTRALFAQDAPHHGGCRVWRSFGPHRQGRRAHRCRPRRP